VLGSARRAPSMPGWNLRDQGEVLHAGVRRPTSSDERPTVKCLAGGSKARHLRGMIPPLLAVDVIGDSTPVTVGLMLSVAFLAFAWGEARSKLSQVISDNAEAKKEREATNNRVGALELGKAASDIQLANISQTLTKMDSKVDRILEGETHNQRRRKDDAA
jgi:hypothetical protein